jgi:hypothetical protein
MDFAKSLYLVMEIQSLCYFIKGLAYLDCNDADYASFDARDKELKRFLFLPTPIDFLYGYKSRKQLERAERKASL